MPGKLLLSSLLFLFVLFACKTDDDYTPLSINVEADFADIIQNQTTDIFMLSNDTNLPLSGTLSVTTSVDAIIELIDPNNTPNNPSDDLIRYTPNGNFTGQDVFQYTICDDSQSNCAAGTVTVNVQPGSPVNYDLDEMPYEKLSDYNFFEGTMANLNPVFGLVPFKPISSLFSDYAIKKRFVWMPNNVSAQYVNDHEVLDFPEGSILIKNFFYNNVQPGNTTRIIETRLMIKKANKWVFANYIWNAEQTEAFFNLDGGTTSVVWLQNGIEKTVEYRIPAESQCFTCHKSVIDNTPIGLKPQNLNGNYPYPDGIKNQLVKFVEMGYLEGTPPTNINTVVPWDDTSWSLDLRVRSYFDINCAHCHADVKHCDYRPIRLAFNESADPLNLGVCVDPDTNIPPFTKIINPGDINTSVLHFRFSTTEEQYRMPLFGRTLVHEEALQLVEEWINSLSINCD